MSSSSNRLKAAIKTNVEVRWKSPQGWDIKSVMISPKTQSMHHNLPNCQDGLQVKDVEDVDQQSFHFFRIGFLYYAKPNRVNRAFIKYGDKLTLQTTNNFVRIIIIFEYPYEFASNVIYLQKYFLCSVQILPSIA